MAEAYKDLDPDNMPRSPGMTYQDLLDCSVAEAESEVRTWQHMWRQETGEKPTTLLSALGSTDPFPIISKMITILRRGGEVLLHASLLENVAEKHDDGGATDGTGTDAGAPGPCTGRLRHCDAVCDFFGQATSPYNVVSVVSAISRS